MQNKTILNPLFPFSPSKFPFFYGWAVVFFSTIGLMMSTPGQTIGIGLFTDYVKESTNLSSLEVSLIYSIATILSSFLIKLTGKKLDIIGARLMIILASIGLGLFLLLLASLKPLINITLKENTLFILPFTYLILGFTYLGLRQFGQGLLALTSRYMLAKWFDIKSGLASGISGALSGIFMMSSPSFIIFLLEKNNPQTSLVYLAIITTFGMGIFGWIFYRDNPEECNLLPDGEKHSKKNEIFDHFYLTLNQAKKTLAFWIISFIMSFEAMIKTAFHFHYTTIIKIQTLDKTEAFAIFIPIAIMSALFQPILGFLTDKTSIRFCTFVMVISLAIFTYTITRMNHSFFLIILMITYAISSATFNILVISAFPKYFGRKYLGAISSLNMSNLVFMSAIGPGIFAFNEHFTSNFDLVIYFSLIILLLITISLFLMKPPQELPNHIS